MANAEGKLKLIHLLYVLLTAALGIGIVVGAMRNQQKVNTDDIKTKVSNEVFVMHTEIQQQQYEQIIGGIDRLVLKVDKIAEK